MATGSGKVEARENAFVAAGGSVRVRAFGAAMVRARGRAQIEATDGVSITRHSLAATVSGGHVTDAVRFATPEEWCEYYGIEVDDGVAILYKAVDQDFNSYHGTSYRPGTEPYAPDWDGGEQECGGGLHFSPRPIFALPRPDDSMRFVACPVRLEDMVVHPQGDYPDQVKARGVCGPVYEVHEDGTPVDRGRRQPARASRTAGAVSGQGLVGDRMARRRRPARAARRRRSLQGAAVADLTHSSALRRRSSSERRPVVVRPQPRPCDRARESR